MKEKVENRLARALRLSQALRQMEPANYNRAVLDAAAYMLMELVSIVNDQRPER